MVYYYYCVLLGTALGGGTSGMLRFDFQPSGIPLSLLENDNLKSHAHACKMFLFIRIALYTREIYVFSFHINCTPINMSLEVELLLLLQRLYLTIHVLQIPTYCNRK